jgi:hypothetical protein
MRMPRRSGAWLVAATAAMVAGGLGVAAHDGPAGAQASPPVYVDAAGRGGSCSDARTPAESQNPATPVCSIARGIALAQPAGRVAVRAGTYPALALAGNGGRDAYVTVAAHRGEAVSLPSISLAGDASWLRFEGLQLTGSSSAPTFEIKEGSASHVQLVGSTVTSASKDDILLWAGANQVLLEGNVINSRPAGATGGGSGIAFASMANVPGAPGYPNVEHRAPISNVTIRNNRFTAIGTDAIRPANFRNLLIEGNDITGVTENGDHNDAIQVVFGGRGLVFRNNYVHDNTGQGFFIKDGQTHDVVIANNVFAHNRDVFVQIHLFETIGVSIYNNTSWDNGGGNLLRDGVRHAVVRNNVFEQFGIEATDAAAVRATTSSDYNLFGAAPPMLTRGAHDQVGRPSFVAAGSGDYRFTSRSAGIDSGTAEGAPATDMACRARFDAPGVANRGGGSPPYVDRGALEFRPDSSAADTGARRACVGTPRSAGGPAGAAPARCTCATRAAGPAAASAALRVPRARLRGRRMRLTLRTGNVCRVRISGAARWRPRGARRVRSVRIRPAARRLRVKTTMVVKLPAPRRVAKAVRARRRVILRLRLRLTDCSGATRIARRAPRLRR